MTNRIAAALRFLNSRIREGKEYPDAEWLTQQFFKLRNDEMLALRNEHALQD